MAALLSASLTSEQAQFWFVGRFWGDFSSGQLHGAREHRVTSSSEIGSGRQ
jgi:hypothetical protein